MKKVKVSAKRSANSSLNILFAAESEQMHFMLY